MMKRLGFLFGLCCVLWPPQSLSRGVLWTGLYQRIQNGSGLDHKPAVIRQKAGRAKLRQKRDLVCQINDENGQRMLRFAQRDCARHGTLIVCKTPSQPTESGRYSGEMCWGDIYSTRVLASPKVAPLKRSQAVPTPPPPVVTPPPTVPQSQ